jgi:cytochrome aa3-600 menaquinol oxidase subunit 4
VALVLEEQRRAEAESPALERARGMLQPRFAEERFPWPQVVGYAVSVVLTLAALGLVVRRALPAQALLPVLLVLAAGQAALQLGVFMHVRESRGPAWHLLPLALVFVIAFGLVGMSLWIMAFKWGAA